MNHTGRAAEINSYQILHIKILTHFSLKSHKILYTYNEGLLKQNFCCRLRDFRFEEHLGRVGSSSKISFLIARVTQK